jgi:RNA polymerase sigma factor (sigma-70 family)
MVAMMLGATLAACQATQAGAATTPQASLRAINDLERYCTTCWRNARLPVDVWTDSTQEVFSRLLERVPQTGWESLLRDEGDDKRELLRAIDAVKKRVQRARKLSHNLEGVADYRENRHEGLAAEREAVRLAAGELLTERQQRILHLSLEGWSVNETATELNMSPERVSDEKYKAVGKLRKHLAGRAD